MNSFEIFPEPDSYDPDSNSNEFLNDVRTGYGEMPDSVRYGPESVTAKNPDAAVQTPEETQHFERDLGEIKMLEGQQRWLAGHGWCEIILVDPESGGIRFIDENHKYQDVSLDEFSGLL